MTDEEFKMLVKRNASDIATVLLRTPKVWGDVSRFKYKNSVPPNDLLVNTRSGRVEVNEGCFFGHGCMLLTGNHDYKQFGQDRLKAVPADGRDIILEEGVWLGSGVTVLGPARLGRNSVIGAGSLVLGDVEPYAIYAGHPAKKVGEIAPPSANQKPNPAGNALASKRIESAKTIGIFTHADADCFPLLVRFIESVLECNPFAGNISLNIMDFGMSDAQKEYVNRICAPVIIDESRVRDVLKELCGIDDIVNARYIVPHLGKKYNVSVYCDPNLLLYDAAGMEEPVHSLGRIADVDLIFAPVIDAAYRGREAAAETKFLAPVSPGLMYFKRQFNPKVIMEFQKDANLFPNTELLSSFAHSYKRGLPLDNRYHYQFQHEGYIVLRDRPHMKKAPLLPILFGQLGEFKLNGSKYIRQGLLKNPAEIPDALLTPMWDAYKA